MQAGKLRMLATLGAKRAAAFPDAPTLRESGVDIVNESPFGIGATRGTEPALIKVLHYLAAPLRFALAVTAAPRSIEIMKHIIGRQLFARCRPKRQTENGVAGVNPVQART